LIFNCSQKNVGEAENAKIYFFQLFEQNMYCGQNSDFQRGLLGTSLSAFVNLKDGQNYLGSLRLLKRMKHEKVCVIVCLSSLTLLNDHLAIQEVAISVIHLNHPNF